MKGKFLMAFALGMSVSILSVPLFAHHGNAAYDTDKQITLKGTITEWLWANPHCVIQFDATDEKGQVVHWTAETENAATMTHQGWGKQSFKPGDEVTVDMITVKNGKPIGRIIDVLLPNGQKLIGRVNLQSAKPADYPKP